MSKGQCVMINPPKSIDILVGTAWTWLGWPFRLGRAHPTVPLHVQFGVVGALVGCYLVLLELDVVVGCMVVLGVVGCCHSVFGCSQVGCCWMLLDVV